MERVIRGIILDVDGTLVDSNDAHAESWRRALEEDGIRIGFERVRELIGMGGDKLLPKLTGIAKDSPRGKRIDSRRKEIFRQECLPRIQPFPKAELLLHRMRVEELRLAVASSASKEDLLPLLAKIGGEKLLDGYTSADDVARSKPDADPVEEALSKLGLFPSQALMLGDTPYDIESALKIGVQTIALRCGGWHDRSLLAAIAIYDDPEDLLEHFEVSPLSMAPRLSRPA